MMNFGDTRLPDRFWGKASPCPMTGCWLWAGALRGDYGRFWSGRPRSAHKVAYEAMFGSVPDGLEIDHLCRVRCCVNPCHLEAVTRTVNVRRGVSPAAKNHVRTHCENGHPFDDVNTYRWKKRRFCRACTRAAIATWKATHHEQEREYQRKWYRASKERDRNQVTMEHEE